MLLQRLKLQNFLIFRDVDLDLKDVKLTSIIGQFVSDCRRSNGSGKTALLESVRYALFDQTRSKQKLGIVHQGAGNCVVELDFQLGHRQFKIYRSRTAKGTSAAKVWIDGKVAGNKITVVNDIVKKYLGLDAELFDLVYFFKQRDQFGFAQATPSDRKAVLGKVFKMQHVIKCLEAAKARHKDAAEAHQRARGWADGVQQQMAATDTRAVLEGCIEATSELLVTANVKKDYLSSEYNDRMEDLTEFDIMMESFEDDIAAKAVEADIAFKNISVIAQKIASLQAEGQKTASQLESLRSQASQFKEQVEAGGTGDEAAIDKAIRHAREQLQKVIERFAVVTAEHNTDKLKVHQMDGKIGVECHECYQIVSPAHHTKVMVGVDKRRAKYEIEIVQLEQYKMNFQAEIAALEGKKTFIATAKAAAAQLKQTIEHLATLEKAAKQRDKDIQDYQVERDGVAAKHSELAAQMAAFDISATKDRLVALRESLKKIFSVISVNLTKANNDVARLTGILVAQQSDLQRRIGIESDHKKALAAAHTSGDDVQVYSHVVDIFGKNGIQAIMLENAIGVIEQFSNDVLKKMQTRFLVQMRTQKDTKGGEQRETLDIIVFDNGVARPFESYSGGEQTMINLALRLALSRIISSLHGIQMQSLFLDEVLAELDEVNREEAVKVVAFLAKSYQQVFVISHTDEIKDVIDSALVIERHDAHSEVRLTNGRTKVA